MRAVTWHIFPPKYALCRALGPVWRGVFWSRLSTVRLRDIPAQPFPADGWVRLRPRLAGICGTDMALVTLSTPPGYFGKGLIIEPVVLGHENVSEVVERGPAAEDVAGGVRYNVDPVVPCAARGLEPCPSCRAGQFCACWNVAEKGERTLGFWVGGSKTIGGTWSDSFLAHRSQLVPVPEGLSDEQAVLVDPLSSCVHTVLRRPPGPEDQDVLVVGCGILGLGIIEFLRVQGFKGRLFATARHRFQKALALQFGATEAWDGRDLREKDLIRRVADLYGLPLVKGWCGRPALLGGMDLVYDAIGSGPSLQEVLRVVRPQGTVVLPGMGHPRFVDWDPLVHKQVTVMGSHGRGIETWRGRAVHSYTVVHDLMAEGRFPADKLLTHVFPLEDYRTALGVLTHRGRHGAVHAAFRISG
jgi:threonine dehydrogenase-like Zn-dependent dehydrogenase